MDISKVGIPLQQFWQLASQSGLGNPTGLHGSDPNHIQVMNGGANCSDIGYQPTTDDSFVAGPMQSNPYFNYGPAPMPSIAPQSFPGAPVPTVSTPAATSPTNTGAPICTPQFSCSNNVMYYQTSSCLTQVYQTCSNGCSGNSCSVITPSSGTSTLTSTTASSTNDLLNALSGSVSLSATPVGTAAPLAVVLNGNTSDVTGIGGKPSSLVNGGTIASIQPLSAQQTFTSSDLSANGTGADTTYQQSSGLSKILADLRTALTWALGYLKSLRGA